MLGFKSDRGAAMARRRICRFRHRRERDGLDRLVQQLHNRADGRAGNRQPGRRGRHLHRRNRRQCLRAGGLRGPLFWVSVLAAEHEFRRRGRDERSAARLWGYPTHWRRGTGTDTITFSAPVNDPVIAIWSLGSQPPNSDIHAQLVFDLTPTIVAGGPSTEYAGQAITLSGNTVTGFEGNGTIEFLDKGVTSITFTTPVAENWYAFTVGTAVPEPSTWALMLSASPGSAMRGIDGRKRVARRSPPDRKPTSCVARDRLRGGLSV